jgi:hypothetical protein
MKRARKYKQSKTHIYYEYRGMKFSLSKSLVSLSKYKNVDWVIINEQLIDRIIDER